MNAGKMFFVLSILLKVWNKALLPLCLNSKENSAQCNFGVRSLNSKDADEKY